VEYFNYPVVNLYKGMRERMYQEAHRQGIRVLLTGDFGDHLYNGSENFLSDLLFDGQFGDFIDEIIFYFRKPERRSALKNQYLRQLGKRILFGLPFDVSSLRSNSCPEWLTPLAAEHLTYETSKQSFYLSRMKGVMGLLWAQNDAMSFTSKFNVELRYPYRDRRIIDFVLAIPAYQLYRHGITRLILRNAMRDIFPDILRNRIGKTTLITMLFHGMSDKREDLQAFFSESDTIWQKYVNQVWLLERWDKIFSSTQDGADKIVPWLCIAFLLWYKQVDFSCNKT
jgi:asparagine synthase (glutamine-hydrolysing)